MAHADWNDEYPRDRPIRKALFAVDELCGLSRHARAADEAGGAEPASVKKNETTAFAAAVKREDIGGGERWASRWMSVRTSSRRCRKRPSRWD